MKQINDLIVLSVTKGMSNFVVGKNEVWVYDEDGITDNIELPPSKIRSNGRSGNRHFNNSGIMGLCPMGWTN